VYDAETILKRLDGLIDEDGDEVEVEVVDPNQLELEIN
jgi:hypothetical protein